MALEIIGLVILIVVAVCLAAMGVIMRIRKPYSEKLAQMGGIFDFGARVRGMFPPYVEGMCGAYCMRYFLIHGKKLKGIEGSRIEIPVDSQVAWTFGPVDIQDGDLSAFGMSLDAFQALGQMPGFENITMAKGCLSAVFSIENEGGGQELLNVKVERQRVLAVSKVARKLGCMARI